MKSMFNFFKTVLFGLTLLVISTEFVEAQSRFQNTKSLGLGGTGVAFVNDYDALFVNPANIYHRRAKTFMTIGGFLNFNVQAGGPLANLTAYNQYLTTGVTYTSNEFNNKVIPAFFDTDANKSIGVQFDYVPLGFSYGNSDWAIAGAFRTRVISDTYMSKGALMLYGGMNEEAFGEPTAVNLGQSALAMGEFSLGFAMPVFELEAENGKHRVTAGIAPKLLIGVNYTSFDMNSTLQVKNGEFIKHNIDYQVQGIGGLTEGLDRFIADRQTIDTLKFVDLFGSESTYLDKAGDGAAGVNSTGFGLDLGITYEWFPSFMDDLKLVGAFSITDIGTLEFSQNAGVYGASGEFYFDGIFVDQDRINNEFDGKFGKYFNYVISDSLAEGSYGNFQKRGTSYSKSLPTMFNFGFMAQWKNMLISTDFGRGFDDFGVNSQNYYISTGLEYNIDMIPFVPTIPIRLGYRTGDRKSVV